MDPYVVVYKTLDKSGVEKERKEDRDVSDCSISVENTQNATEIQNSANMITIDKDRTPKRKRGSSGFAAGSQYQYW